MPYISQDRRDELDPLRAELSASIGSAGEMNYTMTRLIHRYIEEYGECYDAYNSMIGVLECCKLELYARLVRPYEDQKIFENGDVHPLKIGNP